MYILPRTYKCNRCGHECEYSPHHEHPAPTVSVNSAALIACPRCWLEWLRGNIGEMEPKQSPEQPIMSFQNLEGVTDTIFRTEAELKDIGVRGAQALLGSHMGTKEDELCPAGMEVERFVELCGEHGEIELCTDCLWYFSMGDLDEDGLCKECQDCGPD